MLHFHPGIAHCWLAIGLTLPCLLQLNGFQLQQPATRWRQHDVPARQLPSKNSVGRRSQGVRLYSENKLWNRLEINEDAEPGWYLLNCVAGLEMDLLRQCRDRCADMPDAHKFVVPSEIKTRSHGANRMVTETKTKYQGYVFAKLRLCPEVYEAIQSLDLCRSWMGTVNHKGHKKLPPIPTQLNELEVEDFGLEELEYEDQEEEIVPEGDEKKEIIVDDEAQDKIDQEAMQAFLGLKVEDMVKVTKPCKFYDEDGVIRRLKDGKILVRFYTYGSMFEEWMDPGDVRKLSEVEVLRGLSGPSQPVTQRDFDGPQGRDGAPTKGRHAAGSFGGDVMGNAKGALGPRNRRQDRVERGQTNRRENWGRGGPDEARKREERNWDWYKEQRRGKEGTFADDEWSFRPGSKPDGALGDADAQWGRPSKRQKRRERDGGQQNRNNDDWSAFVTPASVPAKKAEEDFFSSLMSDLSNDLDTDSKSASGSSDAAAEDDDFFASLMAEISNEEEKKPKKKDDTGSSLYVDDFFASLEANNDEKKQSSKKDPAFDEDDLFDADDDFFKSLDSGLKSERKSTTDDDFFASLERELGGSDSKSEAKSELSSTTDDDFFASLEQELGSALESEKNEGNNPIDDGDDFFASLGDTLSSELKGSDNKDVPSEDETKSKKKTKPGAGTTASADTNTNIQVTSEAPADLSKLTVPELKEMLRARGMKVSGKKAELIERLSG